MLRMPPKPVLGHIRTMSQTDEGFQAFLAYLEVEREELVRTMSSHLDERIVRQAQGGVQLLDAIKYFVEHSKRV